MLIPTRLHEAFGAVAEWSRLSVNGRWVVVV